MSVSFRTLPEHFLVYIGCEGPMCVAENMKVLTDIAAHPDFRKGMRGLLDLSDLTDWKRDFPAILRLHALEAQVHDDPFLPTLLMSLAPNDHIRSLAQDINRTWHSSGREVTVTVETEPEALAVLGIDLPAVAALLEVA